MESLGQKLREAREKHNYSLEQIARDTHISKQYLEALEEENFAVIPGDTYVVGFLRNYSEYLGLNPEELVNLYKNFRIQEQPLPMSELLQGAKPRRRSRALVFILAAVAAIAVAVFLIVRFALPRSQPSGQEPAKPRPSAGAAEYVLSDEAITRWFNQDDTVNVPLDGEQFKVKLITVADGLTVRIPGGTVEMAVGQNRQLDLDGDGRNDIRLQVNDLDVTGSAKRANLSFYKLPKGAVEAAAPPAQGEPGEASGAQPASRPAAAAPAPATEPAVVAAAPAAGTTQDIQSAASPAPFRLSISFRGYCLLRYLADGETRDERFFHKGETFSLDIKREVRLWLSNAGALRLTIAGREVELGRAGEVATRTIRWNESRESGGYRLQVTPSD